MRVTVLLEKELHDFFMSVLVKACFEYPSERIFYS